MQRVPLIRRIQEAGKSVIVDLGPDEIEPFMAAVDPTGLMLWLPAEPADQARVLETVKRW